MEMFIDCLDGTRMYVTVDAAYGVESRLDIHVHSNRGDKVVLDIDQAAALVEQLNAGIATAKAINAASVVPLRKRTGTLNALSTNQVWVLTKNGHKKPDIDFMERGEAVALIGKYVEEYNALNTEEVK